MVDSPLKKVSSFAVRLVLDTHVVMDLWMFCDARVQRLREAIETRAAQWLVTADLRGELEHVLARDWVKRRGLSAAELWKAWDAYATLCPEPQGPVEPRSLVCRDPSDQRFLRLACAQKANVLLSYDKDLLALRRQAKSLGFDIVRPGDCRWIDAQPVETSHR